MKIEVQHCQRKTDWLPVVTTLTRSTSRSRRCLLQQESRAGLHLLRSKRTTTHSPGPPAQKRKDSIDDRREQLRRGSEDRPCTRSPARRSIDVVDGSSWSIPRFRAAVDNWTLLKSMSFEFVRVACLPHEEAVHRAWKPKESPLVWRRKPSDRPWRRMAKKSVRRSKCVKCVCVMTLFQVAHGNQNKMAKLPRTFLNVS